jgi:hypothetical protein
MNGLYQTYFLLCSTTVFAVVAQVFSDLQTKKGLTTTRYITNGIMVAVAVIHFFQFIAVNLQLFTKAADR